jgi:hypothetical protein
MAIRHDDADLAQREWCRRPSPDTVTPPLYGGSYRLPPINHPL